MKAFKGTSKYSPYSFVMKIKISINYLFKRIDIAHEQWYTVDINGNAW